MNLIYHGNVEITIKHKKYKIKNQGTEHLFRMFTSMLVDGSISPASLPYWIMGYKKSPNQLVQDPNPSHHQGSELLNKCVVLHKYANHANKIHSAVFDATITPEYKKSISIEKDDPLSLALLSYDKTSILAVIDFEQEKYNYLSLGNSAIVKWTITLENTPTATEEIK